MKPILAILCVALLVSCSQEVPSPSPAPETLPEPAVAIAPQAGVVPVEPDTQTPPDKLDAEHFFVTIDDSACNGHAATATVKWDASAEKVGGVAIYVESPGNERKLWSEGGAMGEATTGPWIFEKTLFVLEAKETGEVLARHLVESLACGK